jgi:hypothetical protein
VLSVYNGLGGHAAFLQWAQENPTEYYKIAARLIPTEIHHEEDRSIRVIIAPIEPITTEPRVIEANPSSQPKEGE